MGDKVQLFHLTYFRKTYTCTYLSSLMIGRCPDSAYWNLDFSCPNSPMVSNLYWRKKNEEKKLNHAWEHRKKTWGNELELPERLYSETSDLTDQMLACTWYVVPLSPNSNQTGALRECLCNVHIPSCQLWWCSVCLLLERYLGVIPKGLLDICHISLNL